MDGSRKLDVTLASHCTDHDFSVALMDAVESTDAIQVDKVRGGHYPHIQHRHQGLAPCQQFRVWAVIQKNNDFINCFGGMVCESIGFHGSIFPDIKSCSNLDLMQR
jgi:hypothetical protein